MDFTQLTLGQLLCVRDDTIKRNAMSILKTLQKNHKFCPQCKERLVEEGDKLCAGEICVADIPF